MIEVKFSAQAYCKMILHAAKYPHAPVNGVLLATDKKGGGVTIVDCVPLFHLSLNLAPMTEIALTQIEHIATSQHQVIAGYYQAFENMRDMGNDRPVHRLAEKIAENYSNACLVTIDNRHVTLPQEQVAIVVSQYNDGKWGPKMRAGLEQENATLEAASLLLQLQSYDQLVDFDNHLDCPSKNWMNPEVNFAISQAISSDLDED
ncbi:hypothetical protein B566_EDAN007111 [Ephemera danica]|nr:hypothetical protein B566_EDAN007111 [Ephemera danica]